MQSSCCHAAFNVEPGRGKLCPFMSSRFVDLENNIGSESQKDWYVKTILEKLKEKYGMVGGATRTRCPFCTVKLPRVVLFIRVVSVMTSITK